MYIKIVYQVGINEELNFM